MGRLALAVAAAPRALLPAALAAFWLFARIVAVTSVVAIGEQNLFREMSPSAWALSWLLVFLYAAPVAVVVYLLDLYDGSRSAPARLLPVGRGRRRRPWPRSGTPGGGSS